MTHSEQRQRAFVNALNTALRPRIFRAAERPPEASTLFEREQTHRIKRGQRSSPTYEPGACGARVLRGQRRRFPRPHFWR